MHLKGEGEADRELDRLERQARQSGEPVDKLLAEEMSSRFKARGYGDDNWYSTEVPLDRCYVAHTQFHGDPAPKNQRFVDFLQSRRQEIESGAFACSDKIRGEWSDNMPKPIVVERESGRYYILDGQLRVARHWYHNVQNVKVFIYRGTLDDL